MRCDVFSEQCATCLYGPRPAAGFVADSTRAFVDANELVFECHRSPLVGRSIVCRGYFDRHLAQFEGVAVEEVAQPSYGTALDRDSARQLLTYTRIDIDGRWGVLDAFGELHFDDERRERGVE